MNKLFGISNCDTVKRARKWLETNKIDYSFYDFRKDGLDHDQLARWCQELGWEMLLNKKSRTWRQLDDNTKANINEEQAMKAIISNPTLIKRPVLEADKGLSVGFDEGVYQKYFL